MIKNVKLICKWMENAGRKPVCKIVRITYLLPLLNTTAIFSQTFKPLAHNGLHILIIPKGVKQFHGNFQAILFICNVGYDTLENVALSQIDIIKFFRKSIFAYYWKTVTTWQWNVRFSNRKIWINLELHKLEVVIKFGRGYRGNIQTI